MNPGPRTPIFSALWGVAVLAVAMIDLGLQEAYHRVSSSSVGLVVVVATALLVTFTAFLIHRAPAYRHLEIARRLLFLLAFLMAGYWIIGGALIGLWHDGDRITVVTVVLATGVPLAMLMFTNPNLAARARLALLFASLLYVAAGPILGTLRAKDLVWPPGFQEQDATEDAGRVATVILLLDELNARNTEAITAVLRQHGLKVDMKAVPSVGDGTARVLPAMFTGQLFPDAKPCGLSTICSENLALDFSRIKATRPDIDIVGFYHPYCAIQGLRTCKRPAIDLAFFDFRRWQCGLWRRLGWPLNVDAAICRASAVNAWRSMTERVLAGLQQAPTLVSGGVLFAHLPLPHPPGHSDDGTLAQHYEANLIRAADAIDQTLSKASGNGLKLRVVIFSDHPLRQPAWCRGYPGFFSGKCLTVDRLQDDKVPLIVAGSTTPDLGAKTSNIDVFKLASGWISR